ncbi:MAG TPA: BrnT family toxin [Thermoanaerobaculia bacterium]|jgi:uncharacterized DUF497 family protein|nr:BrnT family toxin [Thermoanaerobaculia bacterium]
MKFEWDPGKAAANFRKHRVSFEEASRAFEDNLSATFPDPDHSLGEARLITYGLGLDEKLLVVFHTETGGTIRIVSARQATRKERKRYEA